MKNLALSLLILLGSGNAMASTLTCYVSDAENFLGEGNYFTYKREVKNTCGEGWSACWEVGKVLEQTYSGTKVDGYSKESILGTFGDAVVALEQHHTNLLTVTTYKKFKDNIFGRDDLYRIYGQAIFAASEGNSEQFYKTYHYDGSSKLLFADLILTVKCSID